VAGDRVEDENGPSPVGCHGNGRKLTFLLSTENGGNFVAVYPKFLVQALGRGHAVSVRFFDT
jgi:hypothetical protein